jgi:FMN phosphatase YigB (HAD superfamily)
MTGNDLGADVLGARNAGIRSAWVDHAGGGVPGDAPARPDRVIASITELLG